MSVHQVGLHSAGRPYEAGQQRRDEKSQPGPLPQVADDPMTVGDAVVLELLRTDDLDVYAAGADVFDRVRNEASGGVARKAWIGGRQDGDPHQVPTRKTAYPSEPSVSCFRWGCLQAAQYDGSPETCRNCSM